MTEQKQIEFERDGRRYTLHVTSWVHMKLDPGTRWTVGSADATPADLAAAGYCRAEDFNRMEEAAQSLGLRLNESRAECSRLRTELSELRGALEFLYDKDSMWHSADEYLDIARSLGWTPEAKP